MKLIKTAGVAGLAAMACSTATVHADAVNLALGSHGVAVEYYLALSPRLNARFILSDMPIDYEKKEDDATVTINYDRTNLGMLFDFRPMAGTFHLTTGLYVGDHNINIGAAVNDTEEYDVGDKTYIGTDLALDSTISFAKAAPYFGFGWGNATTSKGFTANLDIGVLYTGKISVDIDASGRAQEVDNNGNPVGSEFDVAGDALFQEQLEIERSDLEDDAKQLKFSPVIQFGIGYKF